MKQYNLYLHNSGRFEAQAVKLGWSWPAFLFGPLWALAKKLWLHAIGFIVAVVAAQFLFLSVAADNPAYDYVPQLLPWALSILFGAKGNIWRERSLCSRGYALTGSAAANNPEAALAQLGETDER